MRGLFLALGLVTLPGLAGATPTIASGAYDNTLLIGVDPATSAVSGYFDMTRGGQPSFSCIFYLKGRLAGRMGKLATFFPGDPKGDLIAGALRSLGPGKLRLALATEHGGCANVWQFADMSQPADFALQQAQPWTSVRVVKANKAYFYAAPGAAHGKAYIVKGDGVGVRATQPGWAQADFVGENSASSGWLRESDLYPAP